MGESEMGHADPIADSVDPFHLNNHSSVALSHDFDGTDLDDWLNIRVVHHIGLKKRRMRIERCQKVFNRLKQILAYRHICQL
jgi:hypothetical protein